MKKLTISMIAIVLSAVFLVLSGCEMSFDLQETTAPVVTTTEPNTAVIEVTDESGVVLETQTVTASPEAEQLVQNFFEPVTQPAQNGGSTAEAKPNTGVSNDRLQQALQSQEETTAAQQGTEDATTKPAQGGNASTTKPASNGGSFSDKVTKPNSSNNAGSKPDKPSVNILPDDDAILRSSQYLVTCRVVDANGQVSNFRIARKNQKSAIFFNQNAEQLGVIISGDVVYYMSVDQKVYIEIPKSMLEEQAQKEDLDLGVIYQDPMQVERTLVGTSKETIDGVEYTVKEYASGNKDYFVGRTIIMTTASDGSTLYYDSLSPVAPESVFFPPAGFTKEEFNAENVSEFVEELPSEHSHEE